MWWNCWIFDGSINIPIDCSIYPSHFPVGPLIIAAVIFLSMTLLICYNYRKEMKEI